MQRVRRRIVCPLLVDVCHRGKRGGQFLRLVGQKLTIQSQHVFRRYKCPVPILLLEQPNHVLIQFFPLFSQRDDLGGTR